MFAALVTLLAVCTALEISDVDEKAFQSIVSTNQFVLVEFYSLTSTNCMAFGPTYKLIAEELSRKGIVILQVNAEKESKLAEKHHVSALPHIELFSKGFEEKYEGALESSLITAWTLENLIHKAKIITDASQFYELAKQAIPTLLVISQKEEDINLAKKISTSHLGVSVVTFSTSTPPKQLNVTSIPHAILIKNYDEPYTHYSGKMGVPELFSFAHQNVIPIISQFNADFKRIAFMTSKSVLLMFADSINESEYQKIYDLAILKRSGILFAIANSSKPNAEMEMYADILGWSNKMGNTAFLIVDRGRGGYYKMEESKLTADNIDSMITAYVKSKISKYYKSEPIPDSSKEAVLKVVGKTFNGIISNDKTDVIMLFTSRKCEKRQSNLNELTKVAIKMKENKNLVFGTMNMTLNSAEGLTITDIPEIRGYSKLKGKVLTLHGETNENEITEFVAKVIKASEIKKDL